MRFIASLAGFHFPLLCSVFSQFSKDCNGRTFQWILWTHKLDMVPSNCRYHIQFTKNATSTVEDTAVTKQFLNIAPPIAVLESMWGNGGKGYTFRSRLSPHTVGCRFDEREFHWFREFCVFLTPSHLFTQGQYIAFHIYLKVFSYNKRSVEHEFVIRWLSALCDESDLRLLST